MASIVYKGLEKILKTFFLFCKTDKALSQVRMYRRRCIQCGEPALSRARGGSEVEARVPF